MRKAVNTINPGIRLRSAVGIDKIPSASKIPVRRLIRAENNATPSPPAAIPIVVAFTAKLIDAGLTPYAAVRNGRIACVANRSTSVRNAVVAITMKRKTPAVLV